MAGEARVRAERFLREESAFRLGTILTESQHAKTRGLAEVTQRDTAAGVGLLQGVDRELPAVLAATLRGEAFAAWERDVEAAMRGGGRVYFTGCGATGRLSILLEAMWRKACAAEAGMAGYAGRCLSVMAGGDFALIKSVEGYEDFQEFGRRQIRGVGLGEGESPEGMDVVTAITEGGETSFVIGTAWAGLEAGAATYFVYNNPDDLLASVERSRLVIAEDRITKINLTTGPMAVAGSTRMQATTIELAVLGAGLERVFERLAGREPKRVEGYIAGFEALLDVLEAEGSVAAMVSLTEREATLYRRGGRVLYLADGLLLDILTDTTERSPTFSLPPFARVDQPEAPRSWSFVKDPSRGTPEAWERLLGRAIRGIDWRAEDYAAMGAPESVVRSPPALDRATILRFAIGCEPEAVASDLRVALRCDWDDAPALLDAAVDVVLHVGREAPEGALSIALPPPGDGGAGVAAMGAGESMGWSTHLAAKMALNTLSTATMAKIGRVVSNWMVHVTCSNKKLIDRGIRLLADQGGLDYQTAALRLFESIVAIEQLPADRAKPSPVAHALDRLREAQSPPASETPA